MIFKENATEYWESDFVVIPLKGKIPVVNNWSAFAKTRPSEVLLDSWINKYPRHNIGLVTGKLSGVIAIDIDKDEAKRLVPPSPIVKKGKKGETRFFKYNGETNFKRHDIGIELLSDGNQTVLPPSIHPETREAYSWTSTETLLSYDIDDLPVLPQEFFDSVGLVPVLRSNDSGGRHNKLLEICSAMLGRGEAIDDIVEELVRYDKENHKDPYFDDLNEPHKGKGRVSALKMVTSVADTIVKKGGDLKKAPKVEIVLGEEEVQKKIDESKKKMKEVKFPKSSSQVFNELSGFILATSYKRRPKFAMASALSLMGTVLSNKVQFRGSTPNLYQLIVAESGEGKDVPLKTPKKLLIKNGLLQYVGLESYRGDKSIVKRFEVQRERIDTIDEISKLFKAMNSKGNIFSSNIGEVLTEIWNSSADLYTGFTTSNETTGMVFRPCLSLLGATTPDSFSKTFSDGMLMQGFGARFLYIFDEKRVDLTIPEYNWTPTKEVEDWIQWWGKMKVKMKKVDISKTGSVSLDLSTPKPTAQVMKDLDCPEPIEMRLAKGLDERLTEIVKYFDELSYHVPTTVRPVVLRAYQQVEKIMMIHSCARTDFDFPVPVIESEDIEFAFQYVEACIQMTIQFFNDYLIQSKFHKDSQIVINALKRFPKGATQRQLSSELVRHFKAGELYDKKNGIVSNLIEAGRILEYKSEGKGRPVTRYAVNFATMEEE